MASPRRYAVERLTLQSRAPQPSGAEREFIEYAQNWWSAINGRLAEHRGECERALAAAMAHVQEVTPPRGLRSLHASLQSGLRDEYVALTTFYQAIISVESDAALTAHEELVSARNRIKAATTAIFNAASGSSTA